MPTGKDSKDWPSENKWILKYTTAIAVGYNNIFDWVEKKKNPEASLLDEVDDHIEVEDADLNNVNLNVEDYKLKLNDGFVFVNSQNEKVRITDNWSNVSKYYSDKVRFTSVGESVPGKNARRSHIKISDQNCVSERGVEIHRGFIPFVEEVYPDLDKDLDDKNNPLNFLFKEFFNPQYPVFEYDNINDFKRRVPDGIILEEQLYG